MFQVSTVLEDDVTKIKTLPNTSQIDYTKDFFGKKTFLTVSGQLDVENFACSLSDV